MIAGALVALFVFVIVGVIVLGHFLDFRRVAKDGRLRAGGLRTTAVVREASFGSYYRQAQRVELSIGFHAGPTNPRTATYRAILKPTDALDRLVPGTPLPIAYDPTAPDQITILWEDTQLGIELERHG